MTIRDDAIRLLAIREHSRGELERKLRRRGFGPTEIEPVIEDLTWHGLLNEQRMAQVYIAERLRKGFGPLRIRQELRQRGLAEDLIEPALKRSTPEWPHSLAGAHDKRYGGARTADAKEQAKRARFLTYRGFPADLIKDYLKGTGELEDA